LCGTELEVRDVTPCLECGALEDSVAVLRQDIAERFQHDTVEYAVYRILETLEISLCTYCALDIGSYSPDVFGLGKKDRVGFGELQLLRVLRDPSVGKDKYCSECKRRLSFTKFLLEARRLNSSQQADRHRA